MSIMPVLAYIFNQIYNPRSSETPEALDIKSGNFHPLQPWYSFHLPSFYKAVALPYDLCPFRECSPGIFRPRDAFPTLPTFCWISWANLFTNAWYPCT